MLMLPFHSKRLSDNTPAPEAKPATTSGESVDDLDASNENEALPLPETMATEELDDIAECLREIINVYLNADYLIVSINGL